MSKCKRLFRKTENVQIPFKQYVKKYIKHFFAKIVQFASFCLIKSGISKKKVKNAFRQSV